MCWPVVPQTFFFFFFNFLVVNSLVVQWLGLRASTAGGTGSIPGQGTKTKILQAMHGIAKKNNNKNLPCGKVNIKFAI